MRAPRWLVSVTLVAGAAVVALVGPAPARADSTMLCDGYAACSTNGYTTHGYPSHMNTSYWGQYAGVNCTNYTAYVMSTVFHAPTPSYRLGNASQWAASAAAHGVPVNGTPSVGAVAQWDAYATGMGAAGHVAVVERVGPNNSYVDISQDSIGSDVDHYDWRRIYAGTNGWQSWPSHFIHFPITSPIGEGSFIRYLDRVYVIAGGAPEYVSTWSSVGGMHPTTTVTAATFNSLRALPRDGTFLRDVVNNRVYTVAGGAPQYVSTWSSVGGMHSTVLVDAAAITHAGQPAPWNRLLTTPVDGIYLRDLVGSKIYVVAGGAPEYVATWGSVGGMHPTVVVDGAAVAHAGDAAPWNHLTAVPRDGTYLRDLVGSKIYVVAGGAPLFVATWGSVGGMHPTAVVDGAAVAHAGEAAPWNHLTAVPRDGTFVNTLDGTVYEIVAGSPFWLDAWSTVGGQQPSVLVDSWALTHRDDPAAHLRVSPADGTKLAGLPSGAIWRFTGGCYARAHGGQGAPEFPESGLRDYTAC